MPAFPTTFLTIRETRRNLIQWSFQHAALLLPVCSLRSQLRNFTQHPGWGISHYEYTKAKVAV